MPVARAEERRAPIAGAMAANRTGEEAARQPGSLREDRWSGETHATPWYSYERTSLDWQVGCRTHYPPKKDVSRNFPSNGKARCPACEPISGGGPAGQPSAKRPQ